MSGEEAYQRRLALSRGVNPEAAVAASEPPSHPSPVHPAPQEFQELTSSIPLPRPETGDEAYMRRIAMSQLESRPSPPTAQVTPPFEEPAPLAYNPFAPRSVPPPPPPGVGLTLPPDMDARAKAAAAIAARLGALGAAGVAASASTNQEASRDEAPAKRYAYISKTDFQPSPVDIQTRPRRLCCTPDGQMGSQRGSRAWSGW